MAFDTKTITLHEDNLDFLGDEPFDWSEGQVVVVVKAAFDNTELGEQTNFRAFRMVEMVGGSEHSRVAFIESDSGYFFVSADMLLHIVVTFARWD